MKTCQQGQSLQTLNQWSCLLFVYIELLGCWLVYVCVCVCVSLFSHYVQCFCASTLTSGSKACFSQSVQSVSLEDVAGHFLCHLFRLRGYKTRDRAVEVHDKSVGDKENRRRTGEEQKKKKKRNQNEKNQEEEEEGRLQVL